VSEGATSVWLYGSHARGDIDAHSDRDVLVVGTVNRDELLGLGDFGENPSVSQYEWSEIEGMAEYGSLFLHHLRLEGHCLIERPASSGRLARLLENLGQYTRSRRDLRTFQLALNDGRDALRTLTTPMFELSVLATVLRHASVLGCYVIGSPTFGRTTAFSRLAQEWALPPEAVDDFTSLYRFRLHEDGRGEPPYQPTWAHVDLWSGFAERFLDRLEGEIDAYES